MNRSSLQDSACANCSFALFCILDKKSSPQLEDNTSLLKQHRYLKRHEALCLPKNKFQNLYVIKKGAIKAYQVDMSGKELIRGFYFAGEIFGYEAIYAGQYFFSAVALCDTIICEIPYDDFLDLVHSRKMLQKQAMQLISKQLNVGSYLIAITAEQRLASFLIDLLKRLHVNKKELALPMSRQDIGNYLRLTAETVSRILSQLKRQHIIGIDNKKIGVLQPDKLKQIAEGSLSISLAS